jgi:hypothetical protein
MIHIARKVKRNRICGVETIALTGETCGIGKFNGNPCGFRFPIEFFKDWVFLVSEIALDSSFLCLMMDSQQMVFQVRA